MKLFDKKWKWFVLILAIVGAVIGGFFLYVGLFYTCGDCGPRDNISVMKTQCESDGGFFVEALEQCQLPASDGGKVCTDSSECEGFCETYLTQGEISKVAKGDTIEKAGACGQWKNFASGCFYTIEMGKVDKICAI